MHTLERSIRILTRAGKVDAGKEKHHVIDFSDAACIMCSKPTPRQAGSCREGMGALAHHLQ
jgi:hypothetical protein